MSSCKVEAGGVIGTEKQYLLVNFMTGNQEIVQSISDPKQKF